MFDLIQCFGEGPSAQVPHAGSSCKKHTYSFKYITHPGRIQQMSSALRSQSVPCIPKQRCSFPLHLQLSFSPRKEYESAINLFLVTKGLLETIWQHIKDLCFYFNNVFYLPIFIMRFVFDFICFFRSSFDCSSASLFRDPLLRDLRKPDEAAQCIWSNDI